jgi:hypothetical protein
MSKPPPLPPSKPMVYVTHDSKTWGPYDTLALQKHVNDRKFLPTDLANVVGSDNWQPLNTIASFPAVAQEVVVQQKKKKTGCITWGVLGIFIIGFIGAVGDCGSKGSVDSSSAQTDAVMVAPLTDDEIKDAKYMMNYLVSTRYDNVEGITWHTPKKEYDGYKTATYMYIGVPDKGDPFLRLKIRYYGDDWIFIKRYIIKIDDRPAISLLPSSSVSRDNSGGSVWEVFDEPASIHSNILNQIMFADNVTIRMKGDSNYEDVDLTREEMNNFGNIILLYRYLGGKWSFD